MEPLWIKLYLLSRAFFQAVRLVREEAAPVEGFIQFQGGRGILGWDYFAKFRGRNDPGRARSGSGSPEDGSTLRWAIQEPRQIHKRPQWLYRPGSYLDWPEFSHVWPSHFLFYEVFHGAWLLVVPVIRGFSTTSFSLVGGQFNDEYQTCRLPKTWPSGCVNDWILLCYCSD